MRHKSSPCFYVFDPRATIPLLEAAFNLIPLRISRNHTITKPLYLASLPPFSDIYWPATSFLPHPPVHSFFFLSFFFFRKRVGFIASCQQLWCLLVYRLPSYPIKFRSFGRPLKSKPCRTEITNQISNAFSFFKNLWNLSAASLSRDLLPHKQDRVNSEWMRINYPTLYPVTFEWFNLLSICIDSAFTFCELFTKISCFVNGH